MDYGLEVIYPLFISSELDDPSICVNSESIILMLVIGGSVYIDQIGKLEYILYGLIVVPHFDIFWNHSLHLVGVLSCFSR